MEIALDAIEPLAEVVGVVEEQPAGVLRQLAEARVRILAEHVLVLLERLGQRRRRRRPLE